MNILCVDDEPIVIEQLEFILKPAFPSWNLFLANDSIQALSYTNSTYFHLAFLDIEMPGKSGLELAADILAKQPHVQIIILSAHQDFSFAQKAIQVGVKEYLTKPIIESELIDVISKLTPSAFLVNYSRIVNESIVYIQENYRNRISLIDIANEIHVSPSYLSRKFGDEVNTSIMNYLNDYRIEKAKYLLIYTKDSISEIAEQIGFNSLHYFSTQFKKKENVTPKQFREMSHYEQ